MYFKVQMAHALLMHWLASVSFTLSLQAALRQPLLRRWLDLPASPEQAQQRAHAAAVQNADSALYRSAVRPPEGTLIPMSHALREHAAAAAAADVAVSAAVDAGRVAGGHSTSLCHPRASASSILRTADSDLLEKGQGQGDASTAAESPAAAASGVSHGGRSGAPPYSATDSIPQAGVVVNAHTRMGMVPAGTVPEALVEMVAQTSDANVLVIMGAQYSARTQ